MRFPYKAAAHNISFPALAPELRSGGGDFYDRVLSTIESDAAGTSADVSGTAAAEAVAGLLSRSLADAEVMGDPHGFVTPEFLAQVGRDLVLSGESLHVIKMTPAMNDLILASQWHWQSTGAHPSTWTVRATCYGPSTSETKIIPWAGVVFLTWGKTTGAPYRGRPVTQWAKHTAKLSAELERSLADESAMPLTSLVPVPEGLNDEQMTDLATKIKNARGKVTYPETHAGGGGDRQGRPDRDWKPERLGPEFGAAPVELSEKSFMRMLAAFGCPPSIFMDSDGTAQREGLRRWHLSTVKPIARLIETELTRKLDSPIKLKFDSYPLDMVSRATVVDKLVRAGVATATALEAVGIQ